MKTKAQIKAELAALARDCGQIHDKAASENRSKLTPEEHAAFEANVEAARALKLQLQCVELFEAEERSAQADPVTGQRSGLDVSRYSVAKALMESERGQLTGLEAEYAAEHRSGRNGAIAMPVSVFLGETRAVTTTTPAGGPGSNLVSTQLGTLIDRKRPTLAVQLMGATVLSGLTGNLDLPRMKASGSASWVGEHVDATGSDPQFDKISLAPKTVAAKYELSRRMMLQAMSLEETFRSDLGFLLAQAMDGAAITGGGTNQPTGIIANAGTQVLAMAANGGPLGIDTAADMIGMIDDTNANGPRGFLTNSKVRKAAMKLKDAENRPYGQDVVFKGEPVAFSNQVPSTLTKGTGTGLSALIYGQWSDLILAYWSSVDILINPYADSVADKGGVLMHAFLDCDIALRHADSFVVAKDIIA